MPAVQEGLALLGLKMQGSLNSLQLGHSVMIEDTNEIQANIVNAQALLKSTNEINSKDSIIT